MNDEKMNQILRKQLLMEVQDKMQSAANLFQLLKSLDEQMTVKNIWVSCGETQVELEWKDT